MSSIRMNIGPRARLGHPSQDIYAAARVTCLLMGVFCLVAQRSVAALQCPVDAWPCNNTAQCVNSTARCDGRIDCNDGSDEIACNFTCNAAANEFKCLTVDQCIRQEYVCDHGRINICKPY